MNCKIKKTVCSVAILSISLASSAGKMTVDGAGANTIASGSTSGYSKTSDGNVIIAVFMDAYHNIVHAVEDYKTPSVQVGL